MPCLKIRSKTIWRQPIAEQQLLATTNHSAPPGSAATAVPPTDDVHPWSRRNGKISPLLFEQANITRVVLIALSNFFKFILFAQIILNQNGKY